MTSEDVFGRVDVFRTQIERLDAIPQSTEAEFLADFRNVQATLYLLQTSIQALIDVAGHLLARAALTTPRTSHEVFERLQEAGFLDESVVETSRHIVGFRNRIVHLYDRVDDRRVYAILRGHRGDLLSIMDALLAGIASLDDD